MDLYAWTNDASSSLGSHVQGWTSLIWTEGYQEKDTFEVRFPKGSPGVNQLPVLQLVTLSDTRYLQIVLKRETQANEVVISGVGFAYWVLFNRYLGSQDSPKGGPIYTPPGNATVATDPGNLTAAEEYPGNPWRPERAAMLALSHVASFSRDGTAGTIQPSRKYATNFTGTKPADSSAAPPALYSGHIANSTVTTDFSGTTDSATQSWDPDASLWDEVSDLLIQAGGWVRFLRIVGNGNPIPPTTQDTFVSFVWSFGSRSQWTPGATTYYYWPRNVSYTSREHGNITTVAQWNVFNGNQRRNVLYDSSRGDLSDEKFTEYSPETRTTTVWYDNSYPIDIDPWPSDWILGGQIASSASGVLPVSSGTHLYGDQIVHKPIGYKGKTMSRRTQRLIRKSKPKKQYEAMVTDSRFVYNVDYALGDTVRVRTFLGDVVDAVVGSTTRYETRSEGYRVSHALILD